MTSPQGSSVHGILWARILEWVAISYSKGSSQPRDQAWVSRIVGRFFAILATRETHGHNGEKYLHSVHSINVAGELGEESSNGAGDNRTVCRGQQFARRGRGYICSRELVRKI